MVGVEVHEVEDRHHEYAAADSQKPRDQAHRDARREEARNHLESYALKHDLIPHLYQLKQGNYTAERDGGERAAAPVELLVCKGLLLEIRDPHHFQ